MRNEECYVIAGTVRGRTAYFKENLTFRTLYKKEKQYPKSTVRTYINKAKAKYDADLAKEFNYAQNIRIEPYSELIKSIENEKYR